MKRPIIEKNYANRNIVILSKRFRIKPHIIVFIFRKPRIDELQSDEFDEFDYYL